MQQYFACDFDKFKCTAVIFGKKVRGNYAELNTRNVDMT